MRGSDPDRGDTRPLGRPRVAVVTAHWGEEHDEETAVTRLVAGALARHADVDVVHLCTPSETYRSVQESVFAVHRVAVRGVRTSRASIVRATLAHHDGGGHVPRSVASTLQHLDGSAPGLAAKLEEIRPRSLVICGDRIPIGPEDLVNIAGRLVVIPMLSDLNRVNFPPTQRLLGAADLVLALHTGERRAIERVVASPTAVAPLDLALTLNRSATEQGLFGVRFFVPYALLLRNFPPGSPRFDQSVTRDVITMIAGPLRREQITDRSWRATDDQVPDELPLSVAEIDGPHWRIGDDENTLDLPVNPTRVNLWRLMAHALFMVDVRPPGPLGREALESMMFGTPVIVPDGSAAAEHAAAANGGLWYRNHGELLDAVRALTYGPLRVRLAASGRQYTTTHHGDVPGFVDRVHDLVLSPLGRALHPTDGE